MTQLEVQALNALSCCSMRLASAGKRFRNDLESAFHRDPEHKLTVNQALFLWDLVYTYRRQIKDTVLVKHGEHVRLTKQLPDIYQDGDHRQPKRRAPRPHKTTRYEFELQRGGGRLAL